MQYTTHWMNFDLFYLSLVVQLSYVKFSSIATRIDLSTKTITWSTWLASPVGQRCLLGVHPPSCSPGCLWKKYPTVASSWDRPLSSGCGVPGVELALSIPCKCGTPGDCPPIVARGPPPWTLTPTVSGAPFACSIPPLVSCQATSFIPRMLHGMLIPRKSLNETKCWLTIICHSQVLTVCVYIHIHTHTKCVWITCFTQVYYAFIPSTEISCFLTIFPCPKNHNGVNFKVLPTRFLFRVHTV